MADLSTSPSVSIAMSGSGGAGVMTIGQLLLDAATAAGYFGLFGRTLGPQIRGGESAALIRIADHQVSGPDDVFDILLAVDWGNIDRFAAEIPLTENSLILSDPANGPVPEIIARSGARIEEIPMQDTAGKIDGARPNMVGLGVVAGLIGCAGERIVAAVDKQMANKGEAARLGSTEAVKQGLGLAKALTGTVRLPTAPHGDKPRWRLSGNEATAYGALLGGIRFVAAYPITPATDILDWLARAMPCSGGELLQAEDELASIGMCIGASFGGVPSMTATSGPGLSLMTESIGLAVASETPVVIVDVQRGGPSTGIPTKSEQADLNVAVHGLHGDAPTIVTAPLSIADCIFTTQWTVGLAETLQCPALILSEQWMGQAHGVITAPDLKPQTPQRLKAEPVEMDKPYNRYAVTEDGISPFAEPGTEACMYTADGLEHDPVGHPSTQTEHHAEQLNKRLRKLTGHDYGDAWAEIGGDDEADFAVICWGSAAGPVREAVERLAAEGIGVRLIAVRLISPPREREMLKALTGALRALVIEQNHSAQFYRFFRGHYALDIPVESFARPGPLPLRPGEIAALIKSKLE